MKKETKVISIQLEQSMYDELRRMSEENEQPVQGLIRYIIKKYLNETVR